MHTIIFRTLLIYSLISPQIALAIINVDQSVIGSKEDGISHIAHVSIAGAQGNTVKNNIKADLLSQWQHNNDTEFLLLQHAYGTSNGRVDTNRSFAHLRHRTQLNDQWGIEIFAQTGGDTFARLSNRSLIGGGVRLTAIEIDNKTAIYIGLGSFYERERLSRTTGATDLNSRLWRANTYLVLRHRFNEQLRLDSTTYYQPTLQNSSDYRLLEEASANIRLVDSVDLKISLDFSYDSRPPQTVKPNDLRYSTGLEVRF